jgi:23S rRNA pseudouridine2605 synthase
MMNKPRNPRRPAVGTQNEQRSGAGAGRPGERSKSFGRPAGQPGKAPATKGRLSGGFDSTAMERLEQEGLLTNEGKRQLQAQRTTGAEGKRSGGERPTRPDAALRSTRPVQRAKGAPVQPNRGSSGPRIQSDSAHAERLHKVMAQAGLASRRHSEELIQSGRVTVNGTVVTEMGTKVIPGRDLIEVDGRPLGGSENLVYLMLNKPKGYVTTLYDPQGRKKVGDLLGDEVKERVYPVGRLDYDTEGLLLLTNDGELANALMHPAKQVKKTYIAKLRGVPGPAKINQLMAGIELDDGMTAPADIKVIEVQSTNASTLSIRIHEGRNRQVRRMFEAVGHEVIHLRRTTIGPLHVKSLPVGEWRHLTDQELKDVRAAVGIKQQRGIATAAATEGRADRRHPITGGGAPTTEARHKFSRGGPGRSASAVSSGGPRKFAGRTKRFFK